jgi:nicotinate-nucleotide pyrophosphorylase (carboxylating)
MNNEMLKQALSLIPDSIETEASGNMNLNRIASVAQLGVDFISVGALTHSAPVADVSLVFEWE